MQDDDDDDDDDDDNNDPMILNNRAKNHTSERSIVPWTVIFIILQADIVRCAIDDDETCHIMGALPTGYGKSLPMLVTGLLMPPGKYGLDTNYMQHMFISS